MSAASHEGAQRDPFALTASADDYVPSEAIERARRQAVASLSEGRVPVIAGPTGLGKTLTLQLVGRDCADRCQPVYVPYCNLSPDELASLVLGLLEWDRASDPEIALLEAARRAAQSGNRLLLLVDDAAALPGDTAAQLAHWLNASGGALQMVLAGLPGAALRHVRDAFGDQGEEVRLEGGLRPDEIPGYVRRRLEGARAEPALRGALDDSALAELARVSAGNPRRLNLAAQAIVRSVYRAEPATPERRAPAAPPAERPAAPPADSAPAGPGASEMATVGAYRFVRGRFVGTGADAPQAPEAGSVWREPLSARKPARERSAPVSVPEEIDAGLGMAHQPGAGSDPAAEIEDDFDDERLAPRLEPPPPTRWGSRLRAIALGVGAFAFAIGVWSQLGGPARSPSPAPPDAAPRAEAPVPRQATVVEPEMPEAQAAEAVSPAPTAPTLPTAQTEGEAVLPETTATAQAGTSPAPSLEPAAPLAPAPPAGEPDLPPAPASIAPDAAPVPEPVAPPAETVAIAINAMPWAVIEIDGEEVGETPLAGIRLTTGRHRFRARMPDGTVRERVVRIDASTPTVVFE